MLGSGRRRIGTRVGVEKLGRLNESRSRASPWRGNPYKVVCSQKRGFRSCGLPAAKPAYLWRCTRIEVGRVWGRKPLPGQFN